MPYVRRHRTQLEAGAGESGQSSSAGHAGYSSWWVEIPIYLLVFFTPIAIGTVHLWAVGVMLSLSLFAFGALAFRRTRRHAAIMMFPFGVALAAACGWTLLQLVPLPLFLVRWLSPTGAGLVQHVLSSSAPELWQNRWFFPLSLDAPGTAFEFMKFLAYALSFLVVVNYFNSRHRAQRLLKSIAISGFVVAMIGFFTKLFMAKSILGIYSFNGEPFFFSTFVNPNHLAGFLALCSPVAFGVALSSKERQDRALFGFMGVIGGVGVLMSLSRGGIVAYGLGIAFLIMLVTTRRSRKIRNMAAVQISAALVMVLAGYLAYDTILGELKTLGDTQALKEYDKFHSWLATLPIMADYPVVGVGRGAYATVYPQYKTLRSQGTWTHAENQVIQVMVGWGPVFGVAFLILFGLAFWLGLVRTRQSFALSGCLTGVFAVSVQNLVDYNLEVGGVALPFVLVMGVLCAGSFTQAGSPREWELKARLAPWLVRGLVPAAAAVGLICLWYAGAYSLDRNTAALTRAAKAQAKLGPVEPCSASPLGEASCVMLRHHPADFLAPLALGQAWVNAASPRFDRAAHWLSRALFLNPSHAVTHQLTARALFEAGNKPQAMLEYRLAIQWNPGLLRELLTEVKKLSADPLLVLQAVPGDAQAMLQAAYLLHEWQWDEVAEKAARQAQELDSSLAEALRLLANLELAHNHLEEALGIARKLIQVDPLYPEAYLIQGNIYLQQQQPQQAEDAWVLGLNHSPENIPLTYRLAQFYLSQGRWSDAERIANRIQGFALSGDGDQASIHLLKGQIQEAKGLIYEAKVEYEAALTVRPEEPSYLVLVAGLEERLGNWVVAREMYEKAQRLGYSPDAIQDRIARVAKAQDDAKTQSMWKNWVDQPQNSAKELQKQAAIRP